MSVENGFVEIASVLINPEIFTRAYVCDVEKYNCKSQCCYRSCIVPEVEAKKIEAHLDGILTYLSFGEPRRHQKERLCARRLLPAVSHGLRDPRRRGAGHQEELRQQAISLRTPI